MIRKSAIRARSIVVKILRKNKVRSWLFVFAAPFSFLTVLVTGTFDHEWYLAQQSKKGILLSNKLSALGHYILYGRRRGYTPNMFFVGEYFTPHWRTSVLDPLVSYLLRRTLWVKPTSILARAPKSPQGLRSPLVKTLKSLQPSTIIMTEYSPEGSRWGDIRREILSAMRVRAEQESLRDMYQPVDYFDSKLEESYIRRHRDETFDSVGKAPLVSIVTPTWNREGMIGDAIRSVQAQAFQNWEMLIVDDGSTDDTRKIIQQFSKSDPRIKLLRQNHGGVCKARNKALAVANGKWIAFLDSDNTWREPFLQTMVATMKEHRSQAAYSAIRMNNHGVVRFRTTKPNSKLLETGNYIDLNALMIEKSVLEKTGFFDENLRRMVDYDLICKISKVAKLKYVPIIGVEYMDYDDSQRITTTELASWSGVVKSNNFIDWQPKKRRAKLNSVVVLVKDNVGMTVQCLKHLYASMDDKSDIEIILLDSSSSSATCLVLSAIAALHTNTRYVRKPGSSDNTLGANLGFAECRGENVIFLDQHIMVETGWLEPLLAETKSSLIATPVYLKRNRTIMSAGVIFEGNHAEPINFLEDHPLSDLAELDRSYVTQAAVNGCVAIRANDFVKLRGFNPLFDKGFEVHDLCLRAAKLGIRTSVVKASQVTSMQNNKGYDTVSEDTFLKTWDKNIVPGEDLWQRAGFTMQGYKRITKSGKQRPIPMLKVRHSMKQGMRWAIKIAAPPDERRFAWGDMYYAQALANALERLGQTVAIDFLDAHNRPTDYLDDINLDLRGLAPFTPKQGKINLLWVISHPDLVTAESAKAFDKVYAAGLKWVEYMSEKLGQEVKFLPQCTDPEVFNITEKDNEFAGKVLFVGNSRNVLRPIVRDAIAAGMNVAVYGGGWEGLIDKKYIKGTFIPNDKLASAYSSAELVLNDHWEDMRKWGFLSNRLFDAIAAGGCVVTDSVDGISEVFGEVESIRLYRTVEDLREIKNEGWGKSRLDISQRRHQHDKIIQEHSFDTRADDLVAAVRKIYTSRPTF